MNVERLCTFQEGLKASAERVDACPGRALPARGRQNAGLGLGACRWRRPHRSGIGLLRWTLRC